jgi:response regulator RpfG family c-di-GMP phosphodiesterase
MRNIVFVNVKKNLLKEIKELLERNGMLGLRLILCEDISDITSILRSHEINCVFYEITGSTYTKDLEYLRIVAHDTPKIVYGGKLGRKQLLRIINYGCVFYVLERPLNEYDLITAVNNALGYNREVLEKYRNVQKEFVKQQVEKLNNIGIALTREHNLEKLLEQVVFQALALAHCDAGSIYIKEENTLAFMVAQNNTLKKRYGDGYEEKYFKKYHFPITKDRISGYVAATGETLNIRDVYQIQSEKEYRFTDDFDKRNNYLTKSMIAMAMKDPDKNVLGVLQLINCLNDEGKIIPFDKNIESLMQSVTSQAAVAIRNARLIKKVKEAHLDTILRLSVAAEFRDDDTSEHLRRMTTYSTIVARNLGLSEIEVELMKYAAPMHDIGKIGIPDSILFKPGNLTRSEWEEMKKHTLYGAQILEGSDSEILKASSVVALNHHERWDGSGYPRGLKKNEIPVFGQIVSIADVFDALASKRCYKEAYDLRNAVQEIKTASNVSFGSHIVEAFMEGLEEITEVFHNTQKSVFERNSILEDGTIEARLFG